ncbi:MAG: hypothetical protein AAGI88_13230 [Pseudomonadota bacterium]
MDRPTSSTVENISESVADNAQVPGEGGPGVGSPGEESASLNLATDAPSDTVSFRIDDSLSDTPVRASYSDADLHPHEHGMDWRILLGLSVTSVWILAGLVYLTSIVGWPNFLNLPTADIGSFFEGAFAPLAFLWLVIGHFMQQKEISANTRAISMQERSTRRLELHSRRDSYFKLLSLVTKQLDSIAAFHYLSVYGPTGNEEITMDEFSQLRSAAGSGDDTLFMRKMTAAAASYIDDPEGLRELLFGTEIRTRHANNFKATFEKLLDSAGEVDTDSMVRDALLTGSSAGLMYRIIRHVSDEDQLDPLSGARSDAPSS